MRVGLCLPQFRDDAESCIAAARHAEAVGIDGIFVYDHLWPIGQPGRPAIHGMTLLAAVAAETERVHVGTLVARVSLLPNAVLVNQLRTVHRMVGDRLIAGIGTGDSLSKAENEAYGVPFAPAAERLAELADVAERLRDLGITTWLGGRSPRMVEVASATGAAINVWGDLDPTSVGTHVRPGGPEVTWGATVDVVPDGRPLPPGRPFVLTATPSTLAAHLRGLADVGVTWAVVAPPYTAGPSSDAAAVDLVAAAAHASAVSQGRK